MPSAGTPNRQFRPIDGCARTALIGQMLMLVLTLAYSLTTLLQLHAIADMNSDAPTHTQQEYDWFDAVHINTSYTLIGVHILALIVFWVWLYRARKNVQALVSPGTHIDFNPHWVVTGYLIPFANLVIPYRVVSEVWNLSNRGVEPAHRDAFGEKFIAIWWGVTILNFVVERIATALIKRSDDLERLRIADLVSLASNSIGLVLAALTALLIIRLSALQNRAKQNLVAHPETHGSLADAVAGMHWSPALPSVKHP